MSMSAGNGTTGKSEVYTGLEQTFGHVLSRTPLITITKHAPDLHQPLGFAPLIRGLDKTGPSLHLVGIVRTLEKPQNLNALLSGYFAVAGQFPRACFVILTNTEYETALLSRRGVSCFTANELIFTDERLFTIIPHEISFDAVYNAQFFPFKRHQLAILIKKLLLIHKMPSPHEEQEARLMFPNATFANHDSGAYRQLSPREVAWWYGRCGSGLCLSASEGAMRSSMEYLLCGLPVVTTRSLGGRDRYFTDGHVKFVEAEATAVADGVAEVLARRLSRQAIRDRALDMLRFERTNFLKAVNKLAAEVVGLKVPFLDFRPFLQLPIISRPFGALGIPLGSEPGAPNGPRPERPVAN